MCATPVPYTVGLVLSYLVQTGEAHNSPFPCVLPGYGWRGSANGKGNRSSPLYVICLNWIHELQFVDFDSKLFYGRHYQIEPDGEHPTSRTATIGFEPMIPVRCRMLDPFITLAAGFKANP